MSANGYTDAVAYSRCGRNACSVAGHRAAYFIAVSQAAGGVSFAVGTGILPIDQPLIAGCGTAVNRRGCKRNRRSGADCRLIGGNTYRRRNRGHC